MRLLIWIGNVAFLNDFFGLLSVWAARLLLLRGRQQSLTHTSRSSPKLNLSNELSRSPDGGCERGSGGEAAAVPDVVNDEAGGGDEEVVHSVEAPADRLRVHRVVRDSSAGLINHLQHGGWRGRWAVNMSPINMSPASGFALIKIRHLVHLNSHRWCAVFLELFRRGSLLSSWNSAIASVLVDDCVSTRSPPIINMIIKM